MNTGEINKNNDVRISGYIVSGITDKHTLYGEEFFSFLLESKRESGISDTIPITISDRIVKVKDIFIGRFVEIEGQYRSRNQESQSGRRLQLYVFAQYIAFTESEFMHHNTVLLDGFVCSQPIYRKTPKGREITDILIAVNRLFAKSDYIPCITWGRNAVFSGNFLVGDNIQIKGRIQSREYQKEHEGNYETKVAYEVSVNKLNAVSTNNKVIA